jgi:hypothetical protein
MPDSVRLVHATHALLAGMEVRAWFAYVRTKANVSDEPSRDDLSQVRYECLCGGDETLVGVVRSALVSAPIAAAMPPAAWLRGGRDEGVAAAWVRRGLRLRDVGSLHRRVSRRCPAHAPGPHTGEGC